MKFAYLGGVALMIVVRFSKNVILDTPTTSSPVIWNKVLYFNILICSFFVGIHMFELYVDGQEWYSLEM